uniref:Cation/H+ exchanger domain-containing protein n=1 Tax=Kalanchoe fedtschenkoi TaxID=63787 RepID=A0A7N1A5I3_KALFE
MGSVVMEPEDIATYAGESTALKNFTTICTSVGRITSDGVFFRDNPLHYSVPLLLLQLSLCSAIILLFVKAFKPLGQPILLSQILSGLLLGPSILGRFKKFTGTLFPLRSFVVLDTLSTFGYIFYFFLIGAQVDPFLVKKVGKRSFLVGVSAVIVAMILSLSCTFLISNIVKVDERIAKTLPVVALTESVLSFPVVVQYLSELSIINSEFGRVAMSSAIVSNLLGFLLVTPTIILHETPAGKQEWVSTLSNGALLAAVVVFVIRPLILWIVKRSPEGQPLNEELIYSVFVLVLLMGFISQAAGLHIYYGPLVLGIALPPGPPLASSLIEKLDYITHWLFMPLYFIKNGLVINIFAVGSKNYMVLQLIIGVAFFGRFLGAFLASLFTNLPIKDAAALGLVMTAQGLIELGMFKMMRKAKAIGSEAFVVMCASMLIVTAAVTPLIRLLYDPSHRFQVYKRRSVMHLRLDAELRVLVCVHDQDNVPTTINVLEAINSSKRSPMSVSVLHLVELAGRATPLFITHKKTKKSSSNSSHSEPIIKAFRHYEESNNGLVSLHPFTLISSYSTMHDDVCEVALDMKTNLVVIPFHKKYFNHGDLMSAKKNIRTLNKDVLEKAPCSVAILVDKGLLTSSRPVLNSWSAFRVAVLFLGGRDDREALAIGMRAATHENVHLTMFRLVENGNVSSDDLMDKKLDNAMLSEFRDSVTGNHKVKYIEEVVMDGSGTIAVVRSMEEAFELIIVGHRHDEHSQLMMGLLDWNETSELGTIGDILASSDFRGHSTVLVIQQQFQVTPNSKDQTPNATQKHFDTRGDATSEEADDVPIQNAHFYHAK